jgi:uncharacterized protein (TIGR00299 family) protein
MTRALRLLWIDAAAGASGDMILGALVDLGVPLATVRRAIAGMKLDAVRLSRSKVVRGAVSATRLRVAVAGHDHDDHHVHEGTHHGSSWKSIRKTIASGGLPPAVRERSLVVFRRLIEAEAEAHGMSPESVHLHEAGAADAIADVVGVCTCLHALAVDRIVVSPMTTGSGTVQCAHGLYPVPGPATSLLLRGAPITGFPAEGERLTPTGAAILTSIASAFGGPPPMTLLKVGHGAGTRDYADRPNVVRALLGEGAPAAREDGAGGEVVVIEFTVDDATPQALAYASLRLFDAGALDVFTTPVHMKKGRSGHLVTALAHPDAQDAITRTALTETTTLGLRIRRDERVELARTVEKVATRFGAIRVKVGHLEGREVHAWPEYDDCARAARRHDAPLLTVQQAALAARARRVKARR